MTGITAGAHRLWSHKSFKATLPLRVLLVIFVSVAPQRSVIKWGRDHRVHHKCSDTDADPHNIRRGFFFSHMGWLFCRKHPDVALKGRTIDVSDLENDPALAFQNKYHMLLIFVFSGFVPIFTPYYFWGETIVNAFFVAGVLRFIFTFHVTALINSAAHSMGYRPYDKNIQPVDNVSLSVVSLGETWHNYHHSFPWDYKASEYGKYSTNFTTAFIDLMATIGWAYDLKSAAPAVVEGRIDRTGERSLRRRY